MTPNGPEWCDSEGKAWRLAGGKVSDIARDLLGRAEYCRDMADATKAVPA